MHVEESEHTIPWQPPELEELYACSHLPEDHHMSAQNMLAVTG